MAKKLSYTDRPSEMTDEMEAKAGELKSFLRILCFENFVVVDAAIEPKMIVEALANAMRVDERLRAIIMLAEAASDVPPQIANSLIKLGVSAIELIDHEDCQCEKCTRQRIIDSEKISKN